MNEKTKLKKLREKYSNLDHPHWTKEQWLKKIDVIFKEGHWSEKWDLKTQIIRELEKCYTAPGKRAKVLESELEYLGDKDVQRKREVESILEKEKKSRWGIFNKRVDDALKWYNQL